MLTKAQLEGFERDGFLRIEGVFSREDAARMRQDIWSLVEKRDGLRREDPSTWHGRDPRGFQTLTRSGAFDALGSGTLPAALDDLLGAGEWPRPARWGQPLVSLPRPSADWSLPHSGWHIDWPPRATSGPLFAARVLAFLDGVDPRGGGTAVLAGSHRLDAKIIAAGSAGKHSTDLRRRLVRTSPWLAWLFTKDGSHDRVEHFMEGESRVDGFPLRVVELTGEPSEAFLMHPWLFHATTPNVSSKPRMIVSHSINTARGQLLFLPASDA